MSEFRFNKLKKEWVLFSPKRSRRPNEFTNIDIMNASELNCPFEKSRENLTPKEIYRVEKDGSWSIRVVPNLYNALSIEEDNSFSRDEYFEKIGGFGAHEVIIETPEHKTMMYHFDKEKFLEYFGVLKARFDNLSEDSRIEYISLFKNNGELAGASLKHSHTQLIGLPFVPKNIQTQIQEYKDYYLEHKRNYFDDYIYEECFDKQRVIYENDFFIAFCPYASKYAFEVSIISKTDITSFMDMDEKQLDELAEISHIIFEKLYFALEDFSFNMLIKNTPYKMNDKNSYRFYIEIVPRITNIAGFELESGVFINTVLPEMAAKILRKEDD